MIVDVTPNDLAYAYGTPTVRATEALLLWLLFSIHSSLGFSSDSRMRSHGVPVGSGRRGGGGAAAVADNQGVLLSPAHALLHHRYQYSRLLCARFGCTVESDWKNYPQ